MGLIVDDWVARRPLSPIRGRGVPHGHPVQWGAHHHLGYALLVLSMGIVTLTTTLFGLASLSRENMDRWLGGLRRRFARENWVRTDGTPGTTGRFQRMGEDLTALAEDLEPRGCEDEPPD